MQLLGGRYRPEFCLFGESFRGFSGKLCVLKKTLFRLILSWFVWGNLGLSEVNVGGGVAVTVFLFVAWKIFRPGKALKG